MKERTLSWTSTGNEYENIKSQKKDLRGERNHIRTFELIRQRVKFHEPGVAALRLVLTQYITGGDIRERSPISHRFHLLWTMSPFSGRGREPSGTEKSPVK